MKQGHLTLHLSAAMVVLFASMPWTAAQTTQNAVGVPVSIVVTVRGSDAPKISGENVIVYQGRARAKVTDWVPLQGDRAGLELFVLLDDSRGISQGSQLEDISHFIMAQPTSTKIGVAYMQDGGPKIAQGLTTDHTLAAAALHVSLGSLARSASPYVALRDLIKQWPAGNGRREILMISSGHDEVNGDSGPGQDNIYVDSAIEEAQRAGIVVSTI